MRHLKFVVNCALVFSSIGAFAQDSARTVQYHSQDIVPIRAKVKYTTLIELPTTEKIMEAATGDKEFWIVDVVGNFCFVHPAKQGINSNLNLITDKGNIYSFTLQDISATSTTPDLKVIVEPADRSAIVAASGPPQFVPAAQLEQSRQQLAALQSHVEQAVDEYKSAYPARLKFDYAYKANEAPFDIQSIYHDDRFTYIKTNAPEKFSVYEMKDGKPNLVTYDLLEINQSRHICASVRLDEVTATQVDQYAAFIHASADDVVDKALNYVFSKDRDFQDFLKTAHAKQVAPALRVRKGPSNGATEQPTKKLAAGVESTASVRAVKA